MPVDQAAPAAPPRPRHVVPPRGVVPPLDAFPTLQPVEVIDEGQGAVLLRSARGELAQLALQLRSATEPVAAVEVVDLDSASVLLQTSLERTIDGRRQELRAELEQVRADAAAHVAAAREDAAAMVAEATDATLQTLLRGIRPATAPRLRVVTAPDLTRPAEPAGRTDPGASADPGGSSPPAGRTDPGGTTEPAAAVPAAAVVGPGAPPRLEASVQQAVAAALAEVFSDAARQARLSERGEDDAPPARPGGVAGVRISAPLAAALDPGRSPAAGTATVPTTAAAPGRTGVGRFLYLDVVLPMVAVVIVLVILLAWVG